MRILWLILCGPALLAAQTLVVRSEPVHLRSGSTREWRSFDAESSGPIFSVSFQSAANDREYALVLRQFDVKSTAWAVTLNGRKLGVLQDDERAMLRVFAIPVGTLHAGSNTLVVDGKGASFSDDIELSAIRIEQKPVSDLLREASVELRIDGAQMPVRFTVVDTKGTLVPFAPLGGPSREATRTGVVYTADGKTRIGLPAGKYKVFASRGFEYSAPSADVSLTAGSSVSHLLPIRRDVPLAGYISADTHIHTRELSGHGDATVRERVLTAVGEGLDLMIVTEHNRISDYSPVVRELGVERWVTVVPGCEVTTAIGHFNIFPLAPGSPVPNPKEERWDALMDSLWGARGVQVVIQNHPRDIHSNYRPFDPAHHDSATGENRNGRPLRVNAMEVVNSGAMYSDPMQLVRDWMGLLTRGLPVAAIGASDTHTVDFVPIGQARTYIAAPENWRQDTKSVFRNLAEGRNLVSYGLATELQHIAGDEVEVTVWGPSWSGADRVTIYSNGIPVWDKAVRVTPKAGKKFVARVKLPLPKHDTALVAVATGPGVLQPFWEVRKSYQPVSDEWKPMVMGVSQAVWLDRDGNGKRDAPLEYASALVARGAEAKGYDASVAAHVKRLLATDQRR